MDPDGPIWAHQISHQNQALKQHRNKRVGSPTPGIAIGDLFQQIRLLMKGLIAHLNIHAEIRADVEWWIDVNQLQPAGVLDLLPKRAGLERRENQLVVAPNELV